MTTTQQLIEIPDFFARIDHVNIYFDNNYHLTECIHMIYLNYHLKMD